MILWEDMPEKKPPLPNQEESQREAMRKMIRKTLALYRTPEKTPPGLKENLDEVYGKYVEIIETQQKKLETEARAAARRKADEEDRERRKRQGLAPRIKIAESTKRRKIILDE